MKQAMFWQPAEGNRVRCNLCHQRCLISPGGRGLCGVRENQNGTLMSLVYERLATQAIDPIEKKPLYHFLPGSRSFSIATRGCNFKCLYCQNCEISQVKATDNLDKDARVPSEAVVRQAQASGCASISYTYSEPTIFFEYALDVARQAVEKGLKNVFVTNGYITPEALREIQPFLHGANIDLKFFREELYRQVCGARLKPVLDMIKLYRDMNIWIELTTLIVPGFNDDEEQIRDIAQFIADIDRGIPWHISAFYPRYKLNHVTPTSAAVLRKARELGNEAGLQYVYTGNISDEYGSTTYCPHCTAPVVQRSGFKVLSMELDNGKCGKCKQPVVGIWK